MRYLLALIWSLVVCGQAFGQSGPLRDSGFDLPPDSPEAAWRGNSDTELLLDLEDADTGQSSLRVSRTDGANQGFASVSQSIPASQFEGRVVRFRAAVRVLPGSEGVGLWLRVDRPEGGSSFFDNMRDRPISDPEWRSYDIVAPVAVGSQQLVVGLLAQSGAAWIDTASIEDLGPIGAGDVGPTPLSPRGRENLEAFALLYGYVRWFHPTPGDVDWNSVALAGVDRVESAADATELSARLNDLFVPLASALQVSSDGIPQARVSQAPSDLVRWSHRGVQMRPGPVYRSELIAADVYEDFTAELPGGVAIRLPLTGPRPSRSWDRTSFDLDRGSSYRPSGDDRTTRLAAVVVAWSVLQHFYPYFDVVGDDWREALPSALADAAVAPSGDEFIGTLERLTVPLIDGHTMIGPQDRSGALPFQWEWIDGQLVITQDVGGLGLSAGDIVVSIEGQPSATALEEQMALISGSRQWQVHRALERLRTGPIGSTTRLEVESIGTGRRPLAVQLERREATDGLRERRPSIISDLGGGIVYIDLTRAAAADLEAVDLSDARAAIFDVRGYPGRVPPSLLSGLVDQQISTAPLQVETAIRPDRVVSGRSTENLAWTLPASSAPFGGQLVFLADARAISYAETLLGMVEAYDLGVIVGAPTAGANGDVNTIILPGGFSLRWTGLEVPRHDGQRLHGVGIPADIVVDRTIDGVRQHRDETLDAALAWLAQELGDGTIGTAATVRPSH